MVEPGGIGGQKICSIWCGKALAWVVLMWTPIFSRPLGGGAIYSETALTQPNPWWRTYDLLYSYYSIQKPSNITWAIPLAPSIGLVLGSGEVAELPGFCG